MTVILKSLAALGAGTLAIVAFWGFLIVATPTVPTKPTPEKIGPALTMGDPKVRDVTEQPHTTAVPKVEPAATAKAAAQPAPLPPPVATTPAAPSPIPPTATESPQEPDTTQIASDQADQPGEAIGAVPEPGGRQRGSAGCTRYKTYDAATQTYRGYDGLIHPCRP